MKLALKWVLVTTTLSTVLMTSMIIHLPPGLQSMQILRRDYQIEIIEELLTKPIITKEIIQKRLSEFKPTKFKNDVITMQLEGIPILIGLLIFFAINTINVVILSWIILKRTRKINP